MSIISGIIYGDKADPDVQRPDLNSDWRTSRVTQVTYVIELHKQIAHNATGAPWICIHYELTNVYSHNKLKVYITHSPESDIGVFFTLK